MPFQKIIAEKVSTAIIRQVELLILQGVLRPGQRLPSERELAETLDVSRPTLREALKDLEQRRLIEARPGGGTFVAEVLGSAFSEPLIELFATHEQAVFDYLVFRKDLEGLAAERAAMHATETDRKIIRSVFQRMEAAHAKRNPTEEADLDADFHMAIVEAGHNVVMMHMMRSIFELLRRGVFYNRGSLYSQKQVRNGLLEQHRTICNAVLDGDPVAARRAVVNHIDYVADHMRAADKKRMLETISQLRFEQECRESGTKKRKRTTSRSTYDSDE